jgi:XisI protein
MDTQLKYQDIIKNILKEHAEYRATIPDSYESQVLFDEQRGRYLVLDIGWNGDKYLHATPIHVDLINNKIWIQYDDTEEGVANDFLAAGVPKDDIDYIFLKWAVPMHPS